MPARSGVPIRSTTKSVGPVILEACHYCIKKVQDPRPAWEGLGLLVTKNTGFHHLFDLTHNSHQKNRV